jgi:nitroimidazol reductase NimA-like FMN-containing flavoprotein (pyridoxamine 5'-phosphate oxidase superfamily)
VDGKIYFATGAGAKKLQNLEANPRVALSVDLYSDSWTHLRGVLVQGRTRSIERGPRFRKIRSALYRKYPQYPDEAAIEEGDSVIVEVTPSRVFSWGFGA